MDAYALAGFSRRHISWLLALPTLPFSKRSPLLPPPASHSAARFLLR